MKTVLSIINEEMQKIGIPYEYMRWTKSPVYPYFIGECSEMQTDSEDGYREYTIMLTGTTKASWLELENYRQMIEDHFPPIYGLRKSTNAGAVVFYYTHSISIPTGEADLKRIQINLQVKMWKGMN